jgi:hypothetical protein
LAKREHVWWMTERQRNGWTFGPTRDNKRYVQRMGVWCAERKAIVARIGFRRSAMQDADTYLTLAVDCLRKAGHEDADRWMYVSIANAWIKLADRAEADDASQGDHEAGPEAGSLGLY